MEVVAGPVVDHSGRPQWSITEAAPKDVRSAPLAAGIARVPAIQWTRGYTNGDCESHPHAGVQLDDGGYLMVGDSVCYTKPHSPLRRSIFIVRTHADAVSYTHLTLPTTPYV